MVKEAPFEVENYGGLVRVFSDGSVKRADDPYAKAPLKDDLGSVIWKDYTFDHSFSLQLRIYRPSSIPPNKKLSIYIYIHGGGYCYGSRTWTMFHNYCHHLASKLQVVVVAPDYRLAPENPLPAAIDDAFTAVKWVQSQFLFKDSASCLIDSADPQRVYLSGDSAGGNACHHLSVGLATLNISPLCIRGYILITPAFGGVRRTYSELLSPLRSLTNMENFDCLFRLALPRGSTRDHPLSNPWGPDSMDLALIGIPPMLVVVAGRDAFRDRHLAYVQALKGMGRDVEMVLFESEKHSFTLFRSDSRANTELMARIMSFIVATGGEAGKTRSLL
ncbi:probable carboxylesterase 15 [Nymphaea colorata]|uniref:probable carboxylesterase 15 n=1 Tax=Nymphaea colorata TaxID=210225 RepID=UPI00129DC961|nr:probable carboxylesterase 15 [Nymphaea colorata]